MEESTENSENKDTKRQVQCLQKVDTILNADAVEFCPIPELEHILLCATYRLEECSSGSETASASENKDATQATQKSMPAPQTRLGGVKVYHLHHENDQLTSKEYSSFNMCGVLDIKWPSRLLHQQTVFGLVDAEGYLQILKLEGNQASLNPLAKGRLSDSSLGLSLEWSGCDQGASNHIVCSDSAGNVTVFDYGEDLIISSQWPAHDYEAWITAFHKFDNNIVYSGGDDCLLKTWDLRDTSRPVLLSRRHQMGVCSIQSHPFKEHIFASGSYDEHLLVWDRRKPKLPLTETFLGGGVWRIKWEPQNGRHILTATMYNGTHIIGCDDLEKNPLPILAQYDDHNLAYGADWCRRSKKSFKKEKENEAVDKSYLDSYIISTCSFYDHSMHLWEWNLND